MKDMYKDIRSDFLFKCSLAQNDSGNGKINTSYTVYVILINQCFNILYISVNIEETV